MVIKYKGKTLKAGTDYTIEYEDNVAKGTATIYIDGKGFYESFTEGTFSIVDHIALSQCSISKISNQYYTGGALKPKPTVSYDGKKLSEGVDYTLAYSKNKAIGKATVSIKGKGSYTGSVNRSFSIVLDGRLNVNMRIGDVQHRVAAKPRQLCALEASVAHNGRRCHARQGSHDEQILRHVPAETSHAGGGRQGREERRLGGLRH